MEFELNSDQILLRDSVQNFVHRFYDFNQRMSRLKNQNSNFDWSGYVENGWLGLSVPEVYEGVGGNIVDLVLVSQELGKALVQEPFYYSVIFPLQIFLFCASENINKKYIPEIISGRLKIAPALNEFLSLGLSSEIQTHAVVDRNSGDYILQGKKNLVVGGASSDFLLVSARIKEEKTNSDRFGIFLVSTDLIGVQSKSFKLHDAVEASDFDFVDVRLSKDQLIFVATEDFAPLQLAFCYAAAGLCADLIGAMEQVIALTSDYLKTRKQFGVSISSFQVLQHKMVDMASHLEMSRSMLYALIDCIENKENSFPFEMASRAKSFVGKSAKIVCGQAIQLHGGIGMTEEYAIGHFYKRSVVSNIIFGTAQYHDELVAEIFG